MLAKIFLVTIIFVEIIPSLWLQTEAQRLFSRQPFYTLESLASPFPANKGEIRKGDFTDLKDLPIQKQSKKPPKIKAKSVVLIDADTAFVLFEKNKNTKRPIASLTKIMTALVVLEKKNLSDVITVGNEIYKLDPEESRMNLQIGERITVENLLHGLLVRSAGDAAVVLAKTVGGSEKKFVNLMNKKAKELGLKNTTFVDSRGFSDKNQSTAFELAILTNHILRNIIINNIVRTKEITVYSVDGHFRHHLETTNRLLLESDLPIIGFKTGYTEKAGENLIITAQKNSRIITAVILNSPDRFAESEELLKWFFASFRY